jgi:hypothetical protein
VSDLDDLRCRVRIDASGLPHRGPAILDRERTRAVHEILSLQYGGIVIADPATEPTDVAFGLLDAGFAPDEDGDVDGVKTPGAAFVAGRCDVDDDAAADRIDERLRWVIGALDPDDLSAWAPAYIESAMALALRGHDEGVATLAALVGGGRTPGTDADHLAAYYLAQTGDPSGWPAIVAELGHKNDHYRMIAARYLLAFRPYDGQVVEGETVDVRGRLVALLEDDDTAMTAQIPALLLEAEVDGDVELLESIAKTHRHVEARDVAEDLLDRVHTGVIPR